MQKLNPWALGLAVGILWGICLFALTLISIWTGYARDVLNLIAQVYPGYSVTCQGSFLGLAYGFVDGFIGCVVLAWVYNLFRNKFGGKA